MKARWIIAAIAFLNTGCYSTVFRSGKPPSDLTVAEDRTMATIVGNVVTIDPPYKLDVYCPKGWAEIEIHLSPYDWLLEQLAGAFYESRTMTVRCVKKSAEQ